MSSSKVTRVERSRSTSQSIHCTFCGKKTIQESGVSPCEHVTYIAVDDGFEYMSERAKELLESMNYSVDLESGCIDVTDNEEVDEPRYDCIDSLTDAMVFEEGYKLAAYQPAPSFYGLYVGYAPVL